MVIGPFTAPRWIAWHSVVLAFPAAVVDSRYARGDVCALYDFCYLGNFVGHATVSEIICLVGTPALDSTIPLFVALQT